MGKTVILDLLHKIRVHEVLEFLNVEGMGQGNTLLANIWWCMKLENMLVVFLVEGSFPCRLGLYNLDMASVGGNQGAILLPEGWNSDRLGDRKCRMTMEIELVKSFHFGSSRSRRFYNNR